MVLGWSSTSSSPFLKALHPARRHLGRSGGVHHLSSPFDYGHLVVPRPALHHLGWLWLGAPPPTPRDHAHVPARRHLGQSGS